MAKSSYRAQTDMILHRRSGERMSKTKGKDSDNSEKGIGIDRVLFYMFIRSNIRYCSHDQAS